MMERLVAFISNESSSKQWGLFQKVQSEIEVLQEKDYDDPYLGVDD